MRRMRGRRRWLTHLARRTLGRKPGRLVVLAHLKGRHIDLDAVVLRDDQALQRVRVSRVRVQREAHGCCRAT